MVKHTNTTAVAAVNTNIAEQVAARGMSLMALARRSGLSYYRLVTGRPLTDNERTAIERVLGPLEPTVYELTTHWRSENS